MTISRDTIGSGPTGSGDYRVTFSQRFGLNKAQRESAAYYTGDLDDALATGLAMAVRFRKLEPEEAACRLLRQHRGIYP